MKAKRISRRSLAASLAAVVAAPAQAPSQTPVPEGQSDLEQAKARLRKSSEALGNVLLAHSVPPAFTFRA